MKAKDFVRRFGWDEAKTIANHNKVKLGLAREIVDWGKQDFYDLKTLVDAYELVQSYGGLEAVNRLICLAYIDSNHPIPRGHEELSIAIQLVESVNEH